MRPVAVNFFLLLVALPAPPLVWGRRMNNREVLEGGAPGRTAGLGGLLARFNLKPPLCDDSVVTQGCAVFGAGPGVVGPGAVRDLLAATSSSVAAFWKGLGFSGETTCAELCAAVRAKLSLMTVLPPSCDVGCITMDGRTWCDVDLDPVVTERESRFKGDLPDFHDKEIVDSAASALAEVGTAFGEGRRGGEIDYDFPQMSRRIANFFRIYPSTHSGAYDLRALGSSSTFAISAPNSLLAELDGNISEADCDSLCLPSHCVGAAAPLCKGCHFCVAAATSRPTPAHEPRPWALCKDHCRKDRCWMMSCQACDFCDAQTTPAPTQGIVSSSCAHWCKANENDCWMLSCKDCDGCVATPTPGPTPPQIVSSSCKSWCTVHSCWMPSCKDCDSCVTTPTPTPTPGPTPPPIVSSSCKSWCEVRHCWMTGCKDCDSCVTTPTPWPTPPLPPTPMLPPPSPPVPPPASTPLLDEYSECPQLVAEHGCDACCIDGSKSLQHVCRASCPAEGYRPSSPPATGWRRETQEVNIKAVQYVSSALTRFRKGHTGNSMIKWFGPGAGRDRRKLHEVVRVLNSISDLLDNVEYVYPGPVCAPNTFAYVYPRSRVCQDSVLESTACTKNDKGQYILYLCDLHMRSPLSVQIETLTHEASHHATAFAEDQVFEGTKAYGRDVCQVLAEREPDKALLNADNICYYIQDVTDDSA